MQYLHGDFAARRVHRFGHHLVFIGFLLRGHTRTAGQGAGSVVGSDAAGDDQAHVAACALGIKRRHAFKTLLGLLQSDMHGAHDDAVFEDREA